MAKTKVPKRKPLPVVVQQQSEFMVEEWAANGPPTHVSLAFKTKTGAKLAYKVWNEVTEAHMATPFIVVLPLEEIW